MQLYSADATISLKKIAHKNTLKQLPSKVANYRLSWVVFSTPNTLTILVARIASWYT